ncbi:phosphoenolpyruvate synthase [Sulfolobus sp. A20]|uniref:PEP/pyruvate-binding domain-containing protein n=1 Tax=Sulfolobaceae TaxID=118883 RepID=UPI00084614CA|nr:MULTISPECIES: PEP/pyruvate-binding domain-containing protein [unclassified Sulfolobus]TRM75311.1 phosphoenolpyruvate synthase [Sulfolobus sp. B5]TRM80801.1 phosphoenolpyruvate synthase [Sulfolobus sp. D5]TRM83968.1 phosphoenolpyruvate synthase [Sulfolobus sp. A20-N-F6]TRM86770.1 phosphoenolpyruvate synthase [Sulfolobus sp. C3]TRM92153.1 phosphoenolpyruvate synthase [Sulfolobus sp. A20-N-G8]TRM98386.1 phosphoenolpyruvate synthase [Sulfolobus sp. E1]TRN01525.1 phosphoenolpyruvate synthase [
MKYTYPLNEINLSMISVVGRKSAYLGELYKMGFDIPYGFVISSRAVEESIKDIKDEISSILSSVNLNDTSDLERKSEYIQKMIINTKLPEDMEKEIYEMYDRLNSKYVAVRATVTSPLSGSSFAGEYETDLFVDREELIKSVKRVIASYFNPRAVAYRILTQNSTKIAILVQTMINPIVAGTSFSIHPITEESDYVFIESAFGLGESVTKGMVTPDQYIVSKSTRSLVSKRISEKSHKLVYDFEGKRIRRVDLNREEGIRESLKDQDAIRIANMTIAIENIFKRNINIEWAMDDRKIYLLEVRGVRRLYPEF